MDNEQKEMWERLTAVEQSTKSAHHRLDSLDKLTESVHILAVETKAMREDVSDITSRVDEIEKVHIAAAARRLSFCDGGDGFGVADVQVRGNEGPHGACVLLPLPPCGGPSGCGRW